MSRIAYGITLTLLLFDLGGDRSIKAADRESGILTFVVNGEDFVRQGFVSKDNWVINFDRLYVNLASAVAYSTPTSFEPQQGDTKEDIADREQAELLDSAKTIDLASGDANAKPIVATEATVPAGFYNALSWQIATANSDSDIAGSTMALIGSATKDGRTIDFDLRFNRPAEYICGEYVGDSRLGIVSATEPGAIEATLHFDHIFGDADVPPEDTLNRDALGFEAIAKLASDGKVELDDADLSAKLNPQDRQRLDEAVIGLGHVGEGHCVVTN